MGCVSDKGFSCSSHKAPCYSSSVKSPRSPFTFYRQDCSENRQGIHVNSLYEVLRVDSLLIRSLLFSSIEVTCRSEQLVDCQSLRDVDVTVT